MESPSKLRNNLELALTGGKFVNSKFVAQSSRSNSGDGQVERRPLRLLPPLNWTVVALGAEIETEAGAIAT